MSTHRKIRNTARSVAQRQPLLSAVHATVLFRPSGRITALRDLKSRLGEIEATGHLIAKEVLAVFDACEVRVTPIVASEVSTELIPVKYSDGSVDIAATIQRGWTRPELWPSVSAEQKARAMAILHHEYPILAKCHGYWVSELLFKIKIVTIRGNAGRPQRTILATPTTPALGPALPEDDSASSSTIAFQYTDGFVVMSDAPSAVKAVDLTNYHLQSEDGEESDSISTDDSAFGSENNDSDNDTVHDDAIEAVAEDLTPLSTRSGKKVGITTKSSTLPLTLTASVGLATVSAVKRKQTETGNVVAEGSGTKKAKTAKVRDSEEQRDEARKRLADKKGKAEAKKREAEVSEAAKARLQQDTNVGIERITNIFTSAENGDEWVIGTGRFTCFVGSSMQICYPAFRRS